MIVSHPSNLARLIDFYGGHMYDERDAATEKIIKPGVIDRMPDMEEMRRTSSQWVLRTHNITKP